MAFDLTQGYKASTISVSQEILQKLGQLANGNVMIQMKTFKHSADPEGAAYDARFKCTRCNASQSMPMDTLLNEAKLLIAMDWCKAHRHDDLKKQTPMSSGRPIAESLDLERELKDLL